MIFENTFDHIDSFDKLIHEYRLPFIRFANSYLHDLASAQDYVTDAIIYYWEKRHDLPEDTNVPAYILTTIKHKCLNHLRHLEVREHVTMQLQSDAEWELTTRIATLQSFEPDEIFTEEIRRIVNRTLDSMPSLTRTIFISSRFRNKLNREIADELGISIKTVESHISKALKKLRIELSDYYSILLVFF